MPLTCDEIQEKIEADDKFLVLYASTVEIDDGDMKHIFKIALQDRFNHFDERIQFYFNADRNCAKQRNFDPDNPAIAIYHKSGVRPSFLQSPQDDDKMMSKLLLGYWILVSIVEVEQKWSLRASNIIFELRMTALVYMS